MTMTTPEALPPPDMRDAEEWVRNRYGVVRAHPEWRALCEAFNAGRGAALAAPQPLDEVAHLVALADARMAGVHSVQQQTAVIVRAALELLEAVEGCEAFPPEKMAAFRRIFGEQPLPQPPKD